MNGDILKQDIFSNKDIRQDLEIEMFLKYYNEHYKSNYIVFQKRDKPDYFIKDSLGNILGIELSSVYKDDKVVGTEHKPNHVGNGLLEIPWDSNTHQEVRNHYFKRIFDKINSKRAKVRLGEYDMTHPIILSLYLNDYYLIHIDESEWRTFVDINNAYFFKIKEFKEIFLIGIRSIDYLVIACGGGTLTQK
ncbi:hypothetical protein HZA75_04145 [Candidatus Roizmanbacteria bacterium]|nr:hypothetical protein [Candidatus Roizmanbacteria bacterium]